MNVSIKDDPRYNWLLVIFVLATIFLLKNLVLPLLPDAFVATYVIQPLLWGVFIWLILVVFPRQRTLGKTSLRSSLIQLGLMIGVLQVVTLLVSGFFSGFGKSPSSFTALGIITNIIFVGTMLVGMELSRAWLINRLGKKHTFLALVFITIVYTFVSIPLIQVRTLSPTVESLAFINSTLLPALAENLLASLLALLGGALASISYRGILLAFWWFCPILPDLSWALEGIVGTAIPILGFVVLQGFYSSRTERGKPTQKRRRERAFPLGWLVIAIIAVVLMWFSVGLFPLQPTLISGGSMSPALEVGDVVIIAKASSDTIEEGDIIQFRDADGMPMVHRVVEIQETETGKFFTTKGDANDNADSQPVASHQVTGKAIFTAPKIGWVAIVIKNFFNL